MENKKLNKIEQRQEIIKIFRNPEISRNDNITTKLF